MKLFGTDGVRGVANLEPMTPERVFALGRAAAALRCVTDASGVRPSVVVGRDTRVSGGMLEGALVAAFCSCGVDVLRVGVAPTPAVAFLTKAYGATLGCVVSASHNPFADNGVKFFSADGYKLSDDEEAAIEAAMSRNGDAQPPRPTGDRVGVVQDAPDADSRYMTFCIDSVRAPKPFSGLRIVLDCANGATHRVAPQIFRRLGAEVRVLFDTPDGRNINEDCGAQHAEALRREVLAVGADAGLAFDGDGDRLIAVSEKGAELSGDHIIAACALHMRDLGELTGRRVVTTVMSNFGFSLAMRQAGIEQQTCAVGDRYVLERMRETGATLGGEASGHIIFLPHHTTGDGILAGIRLLTALRASGKTISELCAVVKPAPQKMVNIEVSSKPPIEDIPGLSEAMAAAERQLDGRGRLLVRYSGTQPMCRVMAEGADAALVERVCEELSSLIRARIGA
jgi:phosphoglucosamine mutase